MFNEFILTTFESMKTIRMHNVNYTGDKGRSKPGDLGVDRKLKPVPKQINKRTLQVRAIL